MTALFARNVNIHRLFRKHSISDILVDPIGSNSNFLRKQTSSRAYGRFPDFIRKARDYDLSPSLFTSAFSSSSAAAATKEAGIVGWYLGMIKCRPILTKSVTSALIYTAADLSSQVHRDGFSFLFHLQNNDVFVFQFHGVYSLLAFLFKLV